MHISLVVVLVGRASVGSCFRLACFPLAAWSFGSFRRFFLGVILEDFFWTSSKHFQFAACAPCVLEGNWRALLCSSNFSNDPLAPRAGFGREFATPSNIFQFCCLAMTLDWRQGLDLEESLRRRQTSSNSAVWQGARGLFLRAEGPFCLVQEVSHPVSDNCLA